MQQHDLIHGTIAMPDGKVVMGKLWGLYQGRKDGFEVREHDPLEAFWLDGGEFTEAEYNEHGDYVMDMVAQHGTLEMCEPADNVEW